MNTTAEKFYYLLDAAGGRSSLTPDSKEAEIKDLVGCTKQEFVEAVDYLLQKKVVILDKEGISIIAPFTPNN